MDKKMVANELVKVAKILSADLLSPFELALRRAIANKIREEKRAGTVSMSMENLMQIVRPPSSSLEGAPQGTNAQYYYAEIFRDYAKDFRSFVKTANMKVAAAGGPVWDALDKDWNTLHDIEYQLDKAAREYDIASSYGGKGAAEAKKMVVEIDKVKKELEKISHTLFGDIVKMETDFVKEFGTPDEFSENERRRIFPM